MGSLSFRKNKHRQSNSSYVMKHFFFFLIAAVLLMSCDQQNKHKENVALIEKYVQAVEELDYESIENLLDESYLGLGPSIGDSIRKTEVIETLKINFEHLYEKAIGCGVSSEEIRRASDIAGQVKKGAHIALTNSINELMGIDEFHDLPCSETANKSCCD